MRAVPTDSIRCLAGVNLVPMRLDVHTIANCKRCLPARSNRCWPETGLAREARVALSRGVHRQSFFLFRRPWKSGGRETDDRPKEQPRGLTLGVVLAASFSGAGETFSRSGSSRKLLGPPQATGCASGTPRHTARQQGCPRNDPRHCICRVTSLAPR